MSGGNLFDNNRTDNTNNNDNEELQSLKQKLKDLREENIS